MADPFIIETELKILLKNGFISRKQYREILSLRPSSRDELKLILRDKEIIDRPDIGEAERLLENPDEPVFAPLSPGTRTPDMKRLQDMAQKVAHTDTTVLILGESGVGKTRLARQIHKQSHRRNGPFVTISCGSIPETMLESELFGVEKGAFTGALKSREGKFLQAHGGTIFLDEIGELTPALQVKLLRAIQERKIEPLGSGTEIQVDVRLIAATNRDLESDVESGRFRRDLYFRLNVVSVTILPLRERQEDILPLALYFLEKLRIKDSMDYRIVDPEVPAILLAYPWPGNIRELENCMERIAVLSHDGEIRAHDFPQKILEEINYRPGMMDSTRFRHMSLNSTPEELSNILDIKVENKTRTDPLELDLSEDHFPALKDLEETFIRKALKLTGGNIIRSASLLQIHRNTLARKLEQLGINAAIYRKK